MTDLAQRRASIRAYGISHRRERATWDRSRKQLLLAFSDAEKARGCVDCGEKDVRVLEFDHIGIGKVADVSRLINRRRSLRMVLTEIDKCVVRCANCHRRRTDQGRSRAYEYHPRRLGSRPEGTYETSGTGRNEG